MFLVIFGCSTLLNTNKKLKRINTLSSLIGFITPIRNILSKKAHTLEDKIKKLTLKKEIAVVNLREIIHQYEHNRITLPKNNNVYLVLYIIIIMQKICMLLSEIIKFFLNLISQVY